MAEKEYIEREAAIESFRQNLDGGYVLTNDAQTTHILQSIPAADVRPVVRGKWIEDRTFGPICSVCSHTAAAGYDEKPWPTPYCPFCGADMREES